MKIMKIAKFMLLSLVFLITGCTASGPAFSPIGNPDINKSLVYIYRPYSVICCGVAPYVYIDDVKHEQLKNNGYLVYTVDPGKRIIETNCKLSDPLTLYLDVVAGNEYYVRWSVEAKTNFGTIIHTFKFGLIPEEYAIQEIRQTKKSQ